MKTANGIRNDLSCRLVTGYHWWPADKRIPGAKRWYHATKDDVAEYTLDNGDTMKVVIHDGFKWGGPTGWPVLRWRRSPLLWGSKFHDALYYGWHSSAFRNGRFKVWINGYETWYWGRHQADQFFRSALIDAGMSRVSAVIVDQVIDLVGEGFGNID